MEDLQLEAIERGKMMSKLMSNHEFKTLILDSYIKDQAIDVGTTFSGSESDLRALGSISHLSEFIQSTLMEYELNKAS